MDAELENAVLAMDDATVAEKPKKKFVVFVDTQVDFMVEGAALYVKGAQDLIGKLNHFAYHLNPDEIAGVLFTYDTHHKTTYPTSEEAKQFPIHCVYGTPGWANVVTHSCNVKTHVLSKGVFNMWEEDGLEVKVPGYHGEPRDEFFYKLRRNGVDTVVIVGVAADFCVKWAADGFLSRDFNVEIPRSLTAGIVRDIDTVAREDYVGAKLTITD